MPDMVRIALDLMGSDEGPELLVAGAARVRQQRPDIRYLLYGRESEVTPLLARYPNVRDVSTFHHTDVAVRMEDKPSQALRAGRRKSSMWLALQAVRDGHADAAGSAGNTRAVVAEGQVCLENTRHNPRPAPPRLLAPPPGRNNRARH